MMPAIKCPLADCTWRGGHGSCRRNRITLQQTLQETNELYCLGWERPEERILREALTGKFSALEATEHEGA